MTSSQLFAAEPAPKLETQGDKESYSIGYQVGQSLNTDGVEVNFERVIEGLQDAVNRKDPRVKDEEMKKKFWLPGAEQIAAAVREVCA